MLFEDTISFTVVAAVADAGIDSIHSMFPLDSGGSTCRLWSRLSWTCRPDKSHQKKMHSKSLDDSCYHCVQSDFFFSSTAKKVLVFRLFKEYSNSNIETYCVLNCIIAWMLESKTKERMTDVAHQLTLGDVEVAAYSRAARTMAMSIVYDLIISLLEMIST